MIRKFFAISMIVFVGGLIEGSAIQARAEDFYKGLRARRRLRHLHSRHRSSYRETYSRKSNGGGRKYGRRGKSLGGELHF